MLQVVNVNTTFTETRITNQLTVQRCVGLDAINYQFIDCVAHARQCFIAGSTVSDQLADQRIVVGRYFVATVQVRVNAHAVATGGMVKGNRARAWHKGFGVFCVDPAFDGVATNDDVVLGEAQWLARGHQDLLLDDVDTCDHLGHRVLDLYAGVHFNEIELTILVQELEGTCAAVTQIDTCLHATGLHFSAGLFVDTGCRCFFNDFLVTTLQRAVAVAQMNGMPLAIRQHLHFDVARVGEEFFQVDHRVAEGSPCFGAGELD